MEAKGMYSAYVGRTKGAGMPVSFSEVVRGVTKREAHAALMVRLGGKKSQSGIVLDRHTYFAIPSDR